MENAARCLNCGATLVGRFCSACGQRALPPHPTIAELAGDAWNELSGYDGRIAATFRGLLKPGLLTRRYIEGQRARYLSPVRVYLFVSLIYFLVAAAAPASVDSSGQQTVGPGVRFGVTGTKPDAMVTPEDREEILRQVDQAPWVLRPMLRAIATNPTDFRARLFTTMPRVFFALLPVFGGIVFLFYRGETFPTALVFAVHVHAFAFVVFTISEAFKFTGSTPIATGVGIVVTIALAAYAFMAFRVVFGGTVPKTLGKMSAIGMLYAVASVPAFIIMLTWAALS